ncbi:glutamate synthase subunit beta [Actinokineospora terrae]|uniref:Glutamate synthase (NADPH/NADH) small chain n=1 Tax=Actinokineospora terrae TaxID=155974 RepID=A0A1H9TVG1_9PSEU|nr:glutamate synthase subunit beta [Actinokineospora terrae]SES00988.1 glutamate synthase (NADPH/NADH) small chain [Actinokineospora terrae]
MADPKGFLTTKRENAKHRPVFLRLKDWREVYEESTTAEFRAEAGQKQAGRCMDCGIPFCHQGCPLGNLIPEWNTLVWREDWKRAADRLHATNNFPEFTGTLCPAPCESACVLGINDDPVSIKRVEVSIVDRAWDEGWITPQVPATRTGKRVAVVGSGPAGLAAAQQLSRAGHDVVVFERADAVGGLLRYGIPEFKMEKARLDRRLAQMRAEGTEFRTGVDVGVDVTAAQLRAEFDAVVLAGGATAWRDLPIPGRELAGVHQAMEYLPPANRVAAGTLDRSPIHAEGKHVVVIGGGDTGADCVGTAHRQGAASVTQLEIMPKPPEARADANPWPTYPLLYRVTSAHEEGGERVYSVSTTEFVGDAGGAVRALRLAEVELVDGRFTPVAGSEREIPADLVTLAMGFVGPEKGALLADLGVDLDPRGNVARGQDFQTSVDGVFTAGDMGRGQSLIVWAIAEGRSAAAGVDAYLTQRSVLPRPIEPTDRPLV